MQTTSAPSTPVSAPRRYKAADFENHARQTSFLPPAFELIPKLLVLLDDPDTNSEMIADIIRVDAGLTTDILQASNSVVVARNSRTDSLSQAIIRLGLREIYRIVLKIVTSPMVSNLDAFGFQRVDLWRHSLACATGAQILARDLTSEDPEVAFTAALLHDIGKLVFAQVAREDYLDLFDSIKLTHEAMFHAERQIYQCDHAEIGSRLLKRWRFPENITLAVAAHHHPDNCPDNAAKLASLIYASNVLAYRLGLGSGNPDYTIQPNPECLKAIDLDPHRLSAYDEEVLEAVRREQERFA